MLFPGVLGVLVVGVARVGFLNVPLGVDVGVLFEGARLCCDGSRDGFSWPGFKGSESPYHPCPAGG